MTQKSVQLSFESGEKELEQSEAKSSEYKSRWREQCLFVFSTILVITLTHCVIWLHWLTPFIFAVASPIVLTVKFVYYWKNKLQYFTIDFCYFTNVFAFVYMWFPDNAYLFQVMFSLANGPVLIAVVVFRNSLVFHHHDKLTSCYIHFLPAILSYCIRWYPSSTSLYWFKSFTLSLPCLDWFWLYGVPFMCYLIHSVLYFFLVNVMCQPKEPYITSYSYLAEKCELFYCIGGTWGQRIVYYGLNWLFCLISLLMGLLAYHSWIAHCVILAFMFFVALCNGASYYMNVFNKKDLTAVE